MKHISGPEVASATLIAFARFCSVVAQYEDCSVNATILGNGLCQSAANIPECDYDGGDCCECSCVDSAEYTCGAEGYTCSDPSCLDPSLEVLYPNCTGDYLWLEDGLCDSINNNAECGYDMGDCCLCSCAEMLFCATSVINCLDPTADSELYECGVSAPTPLPCALGVQLSWTVGNSAQALALAEALNCSGGTFDVTWTGNVTLEESLRVIDGTILNITAGGGDVAIDGGRKLRLFTVIDATLYLSGVTLSSGASFVGGAISASSSALYLHDVSFLENTATGVGGALYLVNESDLSQSGGKSTFSRNAADVNGGAMYVSDGSQATFGAKETLFEDNVAEGNGGAIAVERFSNLTWTDASSFVNNSCRGDGGAVRASIGCGIMWSGEAIFSGNYADSSGGVVFLRTNSSASWKGGTSFTFNRALSSGGVSYVDEYSSLSLSGSWNSISNNAEWGGAFHVRENSHISWSGAATFTNNSALYGGALEVYESGSASWTGPTLFIANNAETGYGGALAVENAAVAWSGPTAFVNNTAMNGGAVHAMINAVVVWSGNTRFLRNSAQGFGGALSLSTQATMWWTGETSFTLNEAVNGGGALEAFGADVWWTAETNISSNFVSKGFGGGISATFSTVTWDALTRFSDNSATVAGGAIYAQHSTISWTSDSNFTDNRAASGGALILDVSIVRWSAATVFASNAAEELAGAMFLYNESLVEWNASTIFQGNSALSGGALFIYSASTVRCSGHTVFGANHATLQGGAVGSYGYRSESGVTRSSLDMAATTLFDNNTCGGSGGGLILLGDLWLDAEYGTQVKFRGNMADVSGGAIYVVENSIGPLFPGIVFEANSAPIGGALYLASSGLALSGNSVDEVSNVTRFHGCLFVANTASRLGGAVHTTAGQDEFVNTSFVGNKAGTGGALRLAGFASISNCSFEDNVSDEDGGPAVSNIGFISMMSGATFAGNKYACAEGEFLDYEATNDSFAKICAGCSSQCTGCSVEDPFLGPVCTAVMEHSTSTGGTLTLDLVSIDPGHWRATATSKEVLACYNPDACRGGVTGAEEFCREGYEGPYCAICSDGYSAGLAFVCTRCSTRSSGVALAIVLAVAAVIALTALISFLVCDEDNQTKRRVVSRIMSYVPLQSVKIIIVVWQILTQFTSVANVIYPEVYQQFLEGINVVNLDLGWMLSFGCIVDLDFHDQLLLATTGPILALLLLGVTYTVAVRTSSDSVETLRTIRHRHVSSILLLTFLVYSSVTFITFRAFACDRLEDGSYYLRADYRVKCDSSRHTAFQVYAGFMIVLYAMGIPVFFGVLLFRNRDALTKTDAIRKQDPRVRSTSQLWEPYKPSVFYYELIECARRLLLAGVTVFIFPDTAAQVAITLLLAFVFALLSESLDPYASRWDKWVSRAGHVVIFVSMYMALLLKVDVSGERYSSQKVFEGILVAAHGAMIAAVFAEIVVLAASLKDRNLENPSPRRRSRQAVVNDQGSWLVEADPLSYADCSGLRPSIAPEEEAHGELSP